MVHFPVQPASRLLSGTEPWQKRRRFHRRFRSLFRADRGFPADFLCYGCPAYLIIKSTFGLQIPKGALSLLFIYSDRTVFRCIEEKFLVGHILEISTDDPTDTPVAHQQDLLIRIKA